MKIFVGSTNPVKVEAVKELLPEYPSIFKDYLLDCKEVNSEVSSQPKSLEELMKGSLNRALNAQGYDYSFGIESGMMRIPFMGQNRWFNTCACTIIHPDA
jgi:non-canonical (house-cleaning) NTP pyrophosphatase